jgi:hypothetical protein
LRNLYGLDVHITTFEGKLMSLISMFQEPFFENSCYLFWEIRRQDREQAGLGNDLPTPNFLS